MPPSNLSDIECRIIGCLMEKSVVTPEQYPLTLNALTSACNQKSSRDPVMTLTPGAVQHAARILEEKHLLRAEEGFKRGVEKYTQRFCNTGFSELQFDSAQYAIVCLLLLRGPQTPGELRARSGRLHAFADNAEVQESLDSLLARDGDPLLVRLPRRPGRKDSEYMHLFAGEVDIDEHLLQAEAARDSAPAARGGLAELERRVSDLEGEVAELRQLLE